MDFLTDFSAVAVVPVNAWLLPKMRIGHTGSSVERVQVNVIVNSPSVPIFILLQYKSGPIVWNFSRTRDTKILGVAISNNSDSPHLVAGLDPSTLIVGDVTATKTSCGSVNSSPDAPRKVYGGIGEDRLNPFLRKLDSAYFVEGSTVNIGEPIKDQETLLSSSIVNSAYSYRKGQEPLVDPTNTMQR